MPHRVLHVVQSLGLGGQERLILHLARGLAKRGHDVTIASLSGGGALRREFEEFRVLDIANAGGFDPTTWARASIAIAKAKPDVVHTHNPQPLLYAVPAARGLGVRAIVHTKHGKNSYGPLARVLVRSVVRQTTAFVAVSNETAEIARRQEEVPESLLHVVPNGIPLSEFHPDEDARRAVRAELGIASDAFVVGSIGRLAPEKDYPLLVRALVPHLSPSFRLVLAGDGASRDEIAAAIPERLRKYVHLLGVRRDVPRILAALDVFALSSITEGLPLAVPEAMAVGLPIVSTAVGGLPSVVNQEVGLLVPSGDEAALGRAIHSLESDRVRRSAMGAAARRVSLSTYALETMVDRYEVLYRAPAERAKSIASTTESPVHAS